MKKLQNVIEDPSIIRTSVQQLVVNWHLTSACNYRCRYCYSTWDHPNGIKEIISDSGKTEALINELASFFSSSNNTNSLRRILKWETVRLSLAGGEPMLYPEALLHILYISKQHGLDLSLITNGSSFDHPKAHLILKHLSMVGVSLDSSSPEKNSVIGRKDRKGRVLNIHSLIETVSQAKNENPNLIIKMNTVVNQVNKNEDLSFFIKRLKPDRWKVLRMLPVLTDDLAVSDPEFEKFIFRHSEHKTLISAEDNQKMTESYIMIDPFGRFFQNRQGYVGKEPYVYSQPILEVGVAKAFSQIYFDAEKFVSRYTALDFFREV